MIQKLSSDLPTTRPNSQLNAQNEKSTKRTFRAYWIEDVQAMQDHSKVWERLAKSALRPNFCLEPNFLIPAFAHLNDVGAKLLVIEAAPPTDDDQAEWCAILPLVKTNLMKLPFRTMEIWKHEQCFDCTPLLRRDCAAAALCFGLEFLKQEGVSILSADTIADEGEFRTVWNQALSKVASTTFVRQAFERACFRPLDDHEEYVKTHVSKSIRKNTRRLSRRLAEQGELEFQISDQNSDFEQLAEQFLEIEASGWKAETGTALACQPSTRQFYLAMINASAKLGRARFLSVTLDEQPIAMLSDLYSENHGFAYKTAFDEAYASFSPGLLAEVHNVEKMHSYGIEYVDSCTEPDNQTINRIWGQRMAFQKTLVALKDGPTRWAINSLPTIKRWVRRFQRKRDET